MNTRLILASRSFFQLRTLSQSAILRSSPGTAVPKEPLTVPPPEGVDVPASPKLEKLVSDISALNLFEVSELSKLLKKRLNLPDAPMMPMQGFAMAAAPAAEEEEAPKATKTEYTVKLTKYDETQKVALIKEIKSLMEGFNLVQAKKFVESIPVVVKDSISKEEAEKLKEALVKVGAIVDIV